MHRLWTVAARNPHDYDLYIDVLPRLTDDEVVEAVDRARPTSLEIAEAMGPHVSGDWHYRDFKWANAVIRLPWRIARRAAANQERELLEGAFETAAQRERPGTKWDVQKNIRAWLRDLKGDAARITARILQAQPDSARHFAELAEDRRVDQRLPAAVRQTRIVRATGLGYVLQRLAGPAIGSIRHLIDLDDIEHVADLAGRGSCV